MAKTSKKNRTGQPASFARKGKSKQRKKSVTSMPTSKSAAKGTKEKGHVKRSKTAAVLETPTKSSQKAHIRTPTKASSQATIRSPTKCATKSGAVPTTPSTVSLRSTTESKRAATLISKLHLKSPTSKSNKPTLKSNKDYGAEDASLVDSVDYNSPVMISWQTIEGVACAIQHHYPGEAENLLKLPYEDQILRVMQK